MSDKNLGRVGLERQLGADDVARAMMNKFVPPAPQTRLYNTREAGDSGNKFGLVVPDQMTMNTVTRATAANIEDNKNILELFPELKRVMQIYVAALSNPTDLKTVDLFFESEDFPGRISEIVGPMADSLREHFKNIYNIKKLIPRILEETLFTKGSYNFIVLPESTLDRAINGSGALKLESFGMKNGHFDSWGLLGNDARTRQAQGKADHVSFEDFFKEQVPEAYDPTIRLDKITFTNTLQRDEEGKHPTADIAIPDVVAFIDNPDILRVPAAMKKVSAQRVSNALRRNTFGMDAYVAEAAADTSTVDRNQLTKEQVQEIHNKVSVNRAYKTDPVYALATPDTLSRQSVGHPGVMHSPQESLMPVHSPGDPENHVGYLMQIDEFGYPVRLAEDSSYYKQLEQRLSKITADISGGQGQSMASEMIGAAKNMQQGTSCNGADMSAFVTTYESLMQRNFVERITNGYFASAVEIGASREFYLSMLARALAHKQTRVLFIPRELVTYIAFDYNKYGIGKSLLEATKMISSQRAMLMVQEMMAKIKSSINYTTLTVTLDENDRDPVDTIEQALHSFARVYQSGFPLGETNPMDIVNAYERNSIKLRVDGNNEAFPKLGTEVDVQQRNYAPPADDLSERMRRDHFMALGLSPEVVDTSYQSEFAASVISANALQEKQFSTLREEFCEGLTDHVRKYTTYSPILQTMLRNIVRMNMKVISEAHLKQLFGSDLENGIIRNVNQYQQVEDVSGEIDLDITKEEVQNMVADAYVGRFLASLRVKLPEGNARRLEEQQQEYSRYKEAISAQLDDFLTPDYVLGLEGVDGETLQIIRACIIGYAMRAWAKENNYLQEMADLFSLDDKLNPVQDWAKASRDHLEAMGKCMGDFGIHIKDVAKSLEVKMGAYASDATVQGDGSVGTTTDTETDTDSGMDDLGLGDLNADETTTEETTDTETGEETTEGDVDAENVDDTQP